MPTDLRLRSLRGHRGRRAAGLLEALTKRLELADEVVDVVGQRADLAGVDAAHGELHGTSHRLVELRIEHAESVGGVSCHVTDALSRCQLRLEGRLRPFEGAGPWIAPSN